MYTFTSLVHFYMAAEIFDEESQTPPLEHQETTQQPLRADYFAKGRRLLVEALRERVRKEVGTNLHETDFKPTTQLPKDLPKELMDENHTYLGYVYSKNGEERTFFVKLENDENGEPKFELKEGRIRDNRKDNRSIFML